MDGYNEMQLNNPYKMLNASSGSLSPDPDGLVPEYPRPQGSQEEGEGAVKRGLPQVCDEVGEEGGEHCGVQDVPGEEECA